MPDPDTGLLSILIPKPLLFSLNEKLILCSIPIVKDLENWYPRYNPAVGSIAALLLIKVSKSLSDKLIRSALSVP